MKKILSIFLLFTLLINLLSIVFCSSLNNNKFNFNDSSNNFIEQFYFNKKKLRKLKQKKIINFIKKRKKQILLKNSKLMDLNNKRFENNLKDKAVNPKINTEQKSYCVFKKRWCGYWKIYICKQDWERALKIIDKIFSNGAKVTKLGKIIAVDLIPLFMMQSEVMKATITIIVAIILKLIEEGFTMACSIIENNKFATQVIVKFWMAIPFWASFR